MKTKLHIVFISCLIILAFSSCRKWTQDYDHRGAGVWEVQKLEVFDLDSITNDFKPVTSYNNPGFIEFYDQNSDNDNNCYYQFDTIVKQHAFKNIELYCNTPNTCYWFKDDKMRLDLWGSDPLFAEHHSVLTIKNISKNKQEWTYYSPVDFYGISSSHVNITIKEVYTVQRKSH